jgi:tRNA dimethylallyltransferase
MRPKVIVILGQTATGKSALAVKIALGHSHGRGKKIKGEIISADSRQVYTGLDIGTGKITKKEMRGVPHHLLDVVKPKEKFTVAEYKKLAEVKIKEILSRGHTPIIVGGTGFYIDAVTKGLIFPEVPPNIKLRKALDKKSSSSLLNMLRKIDKKRAKDIEDKNEQNNKVRIIRAIEIVKALGKVPKIKKSKPIYDFVKIGLHLPTPVLQKKVEKRVAGMFKAGLLKEIQKLKASGVSDKRLKEFGFEYYKPTPEKVITETIKYAKRQMTWFKRDPDIKWLDASKKIDLNKSPF